MKIKFNEIGGKVQQSVLCNKCVFYNTKFCCGIDMENPLFIPCYGIGFRETDLDIFEL